MNWEFTIIMINKNKILSWFNPERTFLLLSLVFGTMILFIFPPMTAPDELGHYAKAYAFSEGKIVPYFEDDPTNDFETWGNYGFDLPKSIKDMNTNALGVDFDTNLTYDYSKLKIENYDDYSSTFTPLGGQLNYSFFQYIPQTIATFLGKLVGLSVLPTYYLAKLFNFFAYVLLMYFAIKVVKFGQWAMVLLALNPMSLELATSTSGDGFTNAVTFLFTAVLSSLIFEEQLRMDKLYFSFLLLIAMVQMKPTLILFGLMYFLISNKKFSVQKKIVYGTAVFIVSVGCYIVWGKLFPSQDRMYMDWGQPNQQLEFVKENPWYFVEVISNTIKNQTVHLLHSYSGKFGLLNRNISYMAVLMYYALVLFSLFVPDENSQEYSRIKPYFRIVSFAFLALFVFLNFFALYQIWTPLGFKEVLGLQGRYFISSGPFALLTLVPSKPVLKHSIFKFITVIGIFLFLSYSTIFLIRTYGFLI